MGRQCFKDFLQIVDFFHALEHAGQVLDALIGKVHPDYKKRLRRWAQTAAQRQSPVIDPRSRQQLRWQTAVSSRGAGIGLLRSQREPDAIWNLSSSGLYFIGSGVVEAGCKTLLVAAANNRACSGRSPEPKISWPCAAFTAAVASKTFGNIG